MLREPEQTDELRRLAMQLALQLPASVNDARRVLALTAECLDEFLIEKAASPAAARASRIWRRPRPMIVNSAPLPVAPSRLAVFLCCLGVLAIAAVLGGLALRVVGYGAVGANLLGIVAVALLFGRGAAVVSSALACLLMNWAVVPPAWDLSLPTTYEICGGVMYGVAAVVVPWIQARREPLRRATLGAVERPLRVLLRRAA